MKIGRKDKLRRNKFNQTVRELLEFIRKRDQRFLAYKKAKEDEKQRKKDIEAERKRKAAAANQKKLEEYREKLRQEYNKMEKDLEEEIIIENKILCEICHKDFKTEGAFKNHWNSMKHKQKVAHFQR